MTICITRGMPQVERVAGACRIEIEALVVAEQVIAGVVDAPEREGRAEMVALGGVVVDHVEDHLDAGLMQAAHHHLEFVDIAGAASVARGRGEKAQGVVAPVVHQLLVDQMRSSKKAWIGINSTAVTPSLTR